MRSFLALTKDPYYSGVRSQEQGKAGVYWIVFGATGRSLGGLFDWVGS